MEFSKYIENTLPDSQRAPVDTVMEFVEVYNRWARDCHHLVKSDRTKLNELTRVNSGARRVLQKIYEKYCTPKNRQYHRTGEGYFFYGGTYNASNKIEIFTELTSNKAIVQTQKIEDIATARKYTVIKQGGIWKIDAVESLAGNNQWGFDIL